MNISTTEEYSLGTPPDSLFNLAPKAHPRWVDNCLVYVYEFLTLNFNFETTSNFPNFYFHQFNQSFEKHYLSPNIPKNHQKIYKTPKT